MLLTDKERAEAYEELMHQNLRPQDAKSVLQYARAIEAKIREKIGKPVAWMMLNKAHGLDPSLHFAPKVDWHITWEAVPLYKLPEVKE